MRSSELARLAGVTVRTLRHYHQIGLLAEPPRTSGDYRDYDVHDLVRVLRIKRLAALGLSLQSLPALLDDAADNPTDSDALLGDLDRELTGEIDRLTAQREVISLLRRERAALDLPPEFARHARLFDPAVPTSLARFDREQLILLSHLAGEEGLTELARFYDGFTDPELIELAARFGARFNALDEDTDPAEMMLLVDETVEQMLPIVRSLGSGDIPFDLGDKARLLGDHSAELLNPVQLRTLALLEERFAAGLSDTP